MATTISISEELKEKIRLLGKGGETYEEIIRRMYEVTKQHILLHYVYDQSDSVSVKEALEDAERRWPESSS